MSEAAWSKDKTCAIAREGLDALGRSKAMYTCLSYCLVAVTLHMLQVLYSTREERQLDSVGSC